MNDDRISQLSKRFKTHGVGRPATTGRNRERRSFYLDVELVERLDDTYRQLSHELYPKQISKSVFLESLIQFALEHQSDLRKALAGTSETDDLADNS